MPDGKTHTRLWRKYAPAFATQAVLAVKIARSTALKPEQYGGEAATGLFLGYLLGLIVEPDLDMVQITTSEGRVLRYGCLLALPWIAFWMPYAIVVRHRSFLSHYPVLSTAVRLLYIAIPFTLFYGVWNVLRWIGEHHVFVLALLLSLSMSDMVHAIADDGWSTATASLRVKRN